MTYAPRPAGSVAVPFMAALNVQGRRCVVVGGDDTAAAKAALLLDGLAHVTVIAAPPAKSVRTLVDERRVEWIARAFEPGDLRGAFLAVNAASDSGVQERVLADARRHRVLLNTVDQPARCDFFSPALVRRSHLQVAISTAGESPFLASALRERIEHVIGAEWGELCGLLGTVRRRLRRMQAPMPRQRRAYRRLLLPDVRELLRRADYEGVSRLATSLTSFREPAAAGRVLLVGAGPGDPLLLTDAAREALASADVVLHDALVSREVLRCCGAETCVVDVGKRAGRPGARQEDINALLLASALAGLHVVRLKGGDPMLFARGGEELSALREAGVEVAVVPGVSSVTAAAAVAGIPLTHRGVASSLAVVTAQEKSGASATRIEEVARSVDTLAVLMPLARLGEIRARLEPVLGPDRPCALVSDATLPSQSIHRSPLSQLRRREPPEASDAPALLLIGEVVRLSPHWHEWGVASARAQSGGR